MADQDRTLWNRRLIQEGSALLTGTFAKEERTGTSGKEERRPGTHAKRGRPGAYRLQAAIAAVHAVAVRAQDTDWPQIHALYEVLEHVTGNPLVTLNGAVALAMVDGPAAALALLDRRTTDDGGVFADHHRMQAVRAHLLEMAGDPTAASHHYRLAAALTTSTPEQRYLTTKAARLQRSSPPPDRLTNGHPRAQRANSYPSQGHFRP